MSSAHTRARARGNAFQDRCTKILEAEGWTTHNQKTVSKAIPIGPGQIRWTSCRNDIFGALDILAVKPGERVRGIQCTLDRGKGRKLKDLVAVPWPAEHMDVEVWFGAKSGEIRVLRLNARSAAVDGTAQLVEVGRYWRGKFYRKEGN